MHVAVRDGKIGSVDHEFPDRYDVDIDLTRSPFKIFCASKQYLNIFYGHEHFFRRELGFCAYAHIEESGLICQSPWESLPYPASGCNAKASPFKLFLCFCQHQEPVAGV